MKEDRQKCTRVRCNLLEADIYVRFPTRVCGKDEIKQYVELQEIQCADGIREQYVLVDYPVTADSVNSFADSADYRTNPEVINQVQKRENLGDIVQVQQMLRNDMSGMRDLIANAKDTLAKLEEYQKNIENKKVEGDKENGEKI